MQADDVDPARFDHVVNNFAELGRFVRFGDDAAESEILIAAHRRVGRVTAGNDRVHGGIDLDQASQKLEIKEIIRSKLLAKVKLVA